jgi:hypothetical protein
LWESFVSLVVSTKAKQKAKKKNSVALVRERTIPTERPPPVGEVSASKKQSKANQTKPNQTKARQGKPKQTKTKQNT